MKTPTKGFPSACNLAALIGIVWMFSAAGGRAESLAILEVPEKLPRATAFNRDYSPPIKIGYAGLNTGQTYKVLVWLLAPNDGYEKASNQWAARTNSIDNLDGTNPAGIIVLAEHMDVFDYGRFDWVVRLLDSGGNEIISAKAEKFVNATANDAPTLDSIGNKTGRVGESINFDITASDPENSLDFQAEGLPPGATLTRTGDNSASFSWTPTSCGTFRVLFYAQDNGDGHLKDAELVDFTIQDDQCCTLVITDQPQSKTIAAGQPVRLGVVAHGEPSALSYQWFHPGGQQIARSGPSFIIDSVAAADSGEYQVVVSNVCTNAPSLPAVLIVTNAAPAIELFDVPALGSFQNLQGRVRNVDPEFYNVAIFIFVPGVGWFSKPTCDQPVLSVRPDGTFEADITTGGTDELASVIRVLLLRNTFNLRCVQGLACLPEEIEQQAVATAEVIRTDPARRVVPFSGYDWTVKSSRTLTGAGPNYFDDGYANVLLERGELHLKITNSSNKWQCAEVICDKSLGYGTYVFETQLPESFDKNAVLGMFTWTDACTDVPHNEIDIEISQWGVANAPTNAQFVVQPFQPAGHRTNFLANSQLSTHVFNWESNRVSFLSYSGAYSVVPERARIFSEWSFSVSSEIPVPASESPRINLWLYDGVPPSNGRELEVIIKKFTFMERLDITKTDVGAKLSWRGVSSGYELERSRSVNGVWEKFEVPFEVKDGLIEVSVAPEAVPQFFRLRYR